ncbi:MAG: hypothetical protein ABSH16_09520 [Sedimentisphaerales bacterium]
MKRLLLVLVIIVLAGAANADVFIYSQKSVGSGINHDIDGYGTFKGTDNGYEVIEMNPSDTNKVEIWTVALTKVNGVKYAEVNEVGEVNCIVANIGNKTVWEIGGEDGDGRFMVIGQAKSKKIDTGYSPVVASALSGIAIWDETTGTHRAYGTAKVTMSLNTRYTKYAIDYGYTTAHTAADALLQALHDYYDYTIITP